MNDINVAQLNNLISSIEKQTTVATKIFVNLPVKDLTKTIDFFTNLGYSFNPRFTDDKTGCMVINEDLFVMVLKEEFFKSFIPNDIADTLKSTESIICLSAEKREAVDELIKKALDAGGTIYKAPQDHGFMYGHGFRDVDGHIWEVMWMNPSAIHS